VLTNIIKGVSIVKITKFDIRNNIVLIFNTPINKLLFNNHRICLFKDALSVSKDIFGQINFLHIRNKMAFKAGKEKG
jgi:uncharacterized protein with WD repeat